MLVDRNTQSIAHHRFRDLPGFLRAGDLLVLNDTKVIPARLWAKKADTGAQIELLLLEELSLNRWRALAKPAKKVKLGSDLTFEHPSLRARLLQKNENGTLELEFLGVPNVRPVLDEIADAPLPPYITRKPHEQHAFDAERYQTIFARHEGAVAAPTAGLHFTQATFDVLRAKNIETCSVTLHVGPGTFLPVKTENVEDHPMHEERYEISEATTEQINKAKLEGRRIVAVGTTSLRVLESLSSLTPSSGSTRLFIYPPYQFKVAGALLTNFHLPRSTLLMLVSAFASRELIRRAYTEAIREKYRFYSYGDCMLVV